MIPTNTKEAFRAFKVAIEILARTTGLSIVSIIYPILIVLLTPDAYWLLASGYIFIIPCINRSILVLFLDTREIQRLQIHRIVLGDPPSYSIAVECWSIETIHGTIVLGQY